jgi:hypothetical protein
MGQLAMGKVKSISKNDEGSSRLMNLTLDKYIIPNANSQYDLLTKFRMIDLYSNLYGNFFALVDWNVNGKNGYVGPDMWLLNIRDVFPEVGAVSVEDSDYVIVRTWRPLSYFESLLKNKSYMNIKEIISALKQKSGSKTVKDSNSTSSRETEAYPSGESATNSGYYEILTQYETDRWVDYCVDANMVFRDQPNPHNDNELPVYGKYSIPLLDDFMGMGDMERGASMQQVVNSIWNMYLDSCKMSMFPPIMVNKDNIAAMSSLKWGPAAKWLVRGQINNAIQAVSLNPKGTETFNNTYNIATGSLLNTNGTTDTAVTNDMEAGYGRTPQALKMQQARENTRDSADRFYMEQFVKKVCRKMINLTAKKLSSNVSIRLFKDEIEQLAQDYPEIDEMYDEKTGKLNISKSKLANTTYDYEIISGSTFAIDKQAQMDGMTELIKTLMKNPGLMEQAKAEGYTVKVGEILKRMVSSMGISDWTKIIEEMPQEQKDRQMLEGDSQKFMAALNQMQGVGQVPPSPEMPPAMQPAQPPINSPMMPGGLQ